MFERARQPPDKLHAMRQTKIVATLGPACEDERTLRGLIEAGADVLHLNFSHSSHGQHARNIQLARRLASECGRTIALMQDLQGPKIRVDSLSGGPVRLRNGSECIISATAPGGSAARFSTTYPRLARDVRPGQAVLLDDGAMGLRASAVRRDHVAIGLSGVERTKALPRSRYSGLRLSSC